MSAHVNRSAGKSVPGQVKDLNDQRPPGLGGFASSVGRSLCHPYCKLPLSWIFIRRAPMSERPFGRNDDFDYVLSLSS
jgi:hypothetical protein